MNRETLVFVALALAWVSGVFFGLGLERKLLFVRRQHSQVHRPDSDSCSPQPLPVIHVEAAEQASDLPQPPPKRMVGRQPLPETVLFRPVRTP